MDWIIITIYTFCLAIITLFSLGQLNLTLIYIKSKRSEPEIPTLQETPAVTVQLPVFNEKYVVKRLIKAVASLDYPLDKLEIQVLDDSNDITKKLVDKEIKKIKAKGINIKAIRRPERTGFKAGALAYGTARASGDFIAIFDADFLPKPDFLIKTLPYFSDTHVGMVQTRWEHLNKNYSLLTRMQAFGLDAHFSIEQSGRNAAGSFINFNGTAGIWRKNCIAEAGGWQHDTLTEDLDLSYRAQLKGWKFKYVESIGSPAELPVIVPAIKSQQYRWNKGAAETARKNLKNVVLSNLSITHKIRAVLHLLNSSVFFFLLIAALLSIPMLYLKAQNPDVKWVFDMGSVFISGFIAIAIFYWYASKSIQKEKTFYYYFTHFPLFLTFSMGLALHNSIAIIEGFTGKKSDFIRTPKFNITKKGQKWQSNVYLKHAINPVTILEGLLMLYFAFGIVTGILLKDYGLLLFHFMLSAGFGFVFYQSLNSLIHARKE